MSIPHLPSRVCNQHSVRSCQPWEESELPKPQTLEATAEGQPGQSCSTRGQSLVEIRFQKSLTGVTWTHCTQHLCCFPLPRETWHPVSAPLGSRTRARGGGFWWLQTTSPSNSANPNKIGKRQWEEMIVSWLFSERKQKKKKCKQEHTLHFGTKSRSLGEKNLQFLLLLVLSPDAGEGCLGWWGLEGKGGEGLRARKTLPTESGREELRRPCLVGRQRPTLWGWRSWRGGERSKWSTGKFWS